MDRITWKYSSEWNELTKKYGYPKPQGNIPMFGLLSNEKKKQISETNYIGLNK